MASTGLEERKLREGPDEAHQPMRRRSTRGGAVSRDHRMPAQSIKTSRAMIPSIDWISRSYVDGVQNRERYHQTARVGDSSNTSPQATAVRLCDQKLASQ